MLISYKRGQTGVILRVKIRDASQSDGRGLAGLTSASAGLIISTIADDEASATPYTQAGSTIDTIATLGTYAAPTSGHCRFKEVDSTNHKGVYELQFENARFAVSDSKYLLVSILGATNCAETDSVIPLVDLDPYNSGVASVSGSVASVTAGVTVSGTVSSNVTQIAGQTASAAAPVVFPASVGTSTYAGGAVASVTGNVGGNVTGSVGSVVGNVGGNVSGSVGSISGVTFPTNFALFSIDGSGRVIVGSNADKAGYSLTQTFPPNFSLLAIDGSGMVSTESSDQVTVAGYASGQDPASYILSTPANKLATDSSGRVTVLSISNPVTVGTNNDKSGYSLVSSGLDLVIVEPSSTYGAAINARQALAILSAGIGGVLLGSGTPQVTVYASNNPTITRITATIDTAKNRTATSLMLPT